MKITVLRKMRYEGTFIYIMQFEYVFQYLFSWNDDGIYQDHVTLLPKWYKRVLYKLGIIAYPYTNDQITEGEQVILSGAMATVDKISSPEYIKAQRTASKRAKVISQNKGCLWQAREAKDGMYYFCLTHKVMTNMVDGKQPSHLNA